jgi:hypothetical protein
LQTTLQLMAAVLQLNASWAPAESQSLDDLIIRRGRDSVLTYDDGISLLVQVIDPRAHASADDVVASARDVAGRPGQLAVVGGVVPVGWRAVLRGARVSFIDVGGAIEIDWPRLRVSSAQFGREVVRRRSPTPLQKGHALVAEELLMAAVEDRNLTITELAREAGVNKSVASRAVAQLAGQGLVEWGGRRAGALRVPSVPDLADLLAARTAWPGREVIVGYGWGRTSLDTAALISRNAVEAGVDVAVTGRAGAAFLGVLGTSAPDEVRCWATVGERSLDEVAAALGLESVPAETANVRVSADRWRIGVHRSASARFDELTATVAHPVRVWCDLHAERRGSEFAAQLWGEINGA